MARLLLTFLTADYIRSFDGALKNGAINLTLLPVYRHVNSKFGEINHVNVAAKLYLLLYDAETCVTGAPC
jgi:hypothetical protein